MDPNDPEHVFAARFGFYRRQLWYIDRFTIRHGHYYRYHVEGRNDMRGGEPFSWSIPDLKGSHAFALRRID